MKNFYKNISLVLIISLTATFLLSCGVKNVNVVSETNETKAITATETKSKLDEVSPIKNEAWFKNGLHSIRNNVTNTYMIVNGNGDIVAKSIEPELESLGVVRDLEENVTNYIYKTY